MRRGIAAAAAGVLVAVLLTHAWAEVQFDVPAGLGDRRVTLTWMPEGDDPLYTGNLEIFFEGRTSIAASEIGFLLFDENSGDLWAIGREADYLARLAFVQGSDTWVVDTLVAGLTPPRQATAVAIHPAGHLLAVGLEDGDVAVWRPGISPTVELHAGHGTTPVAGIAFKPEAVAADSSYVTVGGDGRLVQWARPGAISREVQVDAEAALSAVHVVREGTDEQAIIGYRDGRIAVFALGIDTGEVFTIDAHPGREILQILSSADNRRFATSAAGGQVGIWDRLDGIALGAYREPAGDRIFLGYTPRESAYLAYATAGGEIGVLDGTLGTPFNVSEDLGLEISAFVLSLDGFTGYFGDPSGQLEWWHQGPCVPSPTTPECFGGYIVWRGTTVDTTELIWLRTYAFGDTTWNFTLLDTVRTFIDPDSIIPRGGDPELTVAGPHNGIPYYYSLTKFTRVFRGGQEWLVFDNSPDAQYKGFYREDAEGEPTALIPRVPARSETPLLGDVYVVPDPYIANDPGSHFAEGEPGHVRFFNLPEVATVRIYTVNGELVRTLHHPEFATRISGGSLVWDMKNDYQEDVIAGVYLYAVDTPQGESKTGYLTIVR